MSFGLVLCFLELTCEALVAVFILYVRFDGNSEIVAELAAVNGFKAAYAIKDGAEGPRGWMVFTILISVLLCFHSLQQSIATWNCHWCIYNSQKLWDALYYCRIAAFPGYCQRKHWVLTLETLLSLSVMHLEYVSQSFDCLLTLIFSFLSSWIC